MALALSLLVSAKVCVGGWLDGYYTNNVCVCANPAYPLTVAGWLAGGESRSGGGAGAGSIIAFWTCCVCPPELLAYILIL